MNKLLVLISFTAIFILSSAYGAESPCYKLQRACLAAGYAKNDPRPGKNLWRDCLIPLKLGKRVHQVAIKPQEIDACKADKKKYVHQRKKRNHAVVAVGAMRDSSKSASSPTTTPSPSPSSSAKLKSRSH